MMKQMVTFLGNTYIDLRTHFSGISWWRYRKTLDKEYERMQIFTPVLDIQLYVTNKTQARYLCGLIKTCFDGTSRLPCILTRDEFFSYIIVVSNMEHMSLVSDEYYRDSVDSGIMQGFRF